MSDPKVQKKALMSTCSFYFANHEGKQFSTLGGILEPSGTLLKNTEDQALCQTLQWSDLRYSLSINVFYEGPLWLASVENHWFWQWHFLVLFGCKWDSVFLFNLESIYIMIQKILPKTETSISWYWQLNTLKRAYIRFFFYTRLT